MTEELRGLLVKCQCGEILESMYTYYLNPLDIGRWECDICGENHLIELKINLIREGDPPKEKIKQNPKGVPLKCEKCGELIHSSRTKYINKLAKRSKWRCPNCGAIYLVQKRYRRNVPSEVEF